MTDHNSTDAGILPESLFDDVTIDTVLTPAVEDSPDLPEEKAPATEEVVDDTEEETPETEEEVDDDSAEEEEEKDEEKKAPVEEKKDGLKEVREARDRAVKREEELKVQLTEIETQFKELGAETPKEVLDLVQSFGGIEQARVGAELYKVITDTTSDFNDVLKRAHDLVPDTIQSLVLNIATEVEKDLMAEYKTKIFGRELSPAEMQAVRDFVDFGSTKASDVPEHLLEDEFGNPLPEKTKAAVEAMWRRSRGAEAKINELSNKLDSKLNSFEDKTSNTRRDEYMAKAFGSVADVVTSLGIDKMVDTPEDRSAAGEAITALETLALRFFSQNPSADRALQTALDTLGKPDAASKAKHLDATRQVTKYAKIAVDQASRFVAPVIGQRVERKSSDAEQAGAKVVKTGSGGATKPQKASAAKSDDWDDITLDTVVVTPSRRRR